MNVNTLNEKLLTAFYNSEYRTCKELIEKGAEKEVIVKAYKKIKGMNRTMSQDSIIKDLT